MRYFTGSGAIGSKAIATIHDGNTLVSGPVISCETSVEFGRPQEYNVRFYADNVKSNVCSGTTFDSVLDLSGNCENKSLKARKVIFNPPATIVLWEDGKKTVVKCDDGDTFDEMKGLALCYMKKALGNTSRELNKALRKGKNDASA